MSVKTLFIKTGPVDGNALQRLTAKIERLIVWAGVPFRSDSGWKYLPTSLLSIDAVTEASGPQMDASLMDWMQLPSTLTSLNLGPFSVTNFFFFKGLPVCLRSLTILTRRIEPGACQGLKSHCDLEYLDIRLSSDLNSIKSLLIDAPKSLTTLHISFDVRSAQIELKNQDLIDLDLPHLHTLTIPIFVGMDPLIRYKLPRSITTFRATRIERSIYSRMGNPPNWLPPLPSKI